MIEFSTTMGSYTLESFKTLTDKYGFPAVVIEIGVFEGHTTLNVTNTIAGVLPTYKHYAIDPYHGSPDIDLDVILDAENRFMSNLEQFQYKHNIEFMKMPSKDALMKLYADGVVADLIYIDGNHTAAAVLEDLMLSFNLLKPGGIMLCDDCLTWRQPILQDNPKLAVDSFLNCFWDKAAVEQLDNGYQLAIRKL